ncbi:hypothetical protein ABID56_001260 [Alkalibacillus flavidus]|uniref:Sporulation histidine kinase inhibitor Sda n=1 Tax=Alkalibacillus flavidus TaxID=546021 RepID=A0ABV2KUY6_9BACI
MHQLDDLSLINAYLEAINLNISADFIFLIEKELSYRGFIPKNLLHNHIV